MVDEKRIPIDTLNIETTSLPAQCYNVPIPIVACRDLPSSSICIPMQMEKEKEKAKMPSMCEKNGVRETRTVGNIRTRSTSSMYSLVYSKSRNDKYPFDSNELL